MGDDKCLLALDALREMYELAINNIKLSRVRDADQLLIYPMFAFNVGGKGASGKQC